MNILRHVTYTFVWFYSRHQSQHVNFKW